jgi:hypothetical protein
MLPCPPPSNQRLVMSDVMQGEAAVSNVTGPGAENAGSVSFDMAVDVMESIVRCPETEQSAVPDVCFIQVLDCRQAADELQRFGSYE